jgi:ATP-dependent RNA helicase DDX24/MAK5
MGFICMEEITGEEAEKYLRMPAVKSVVAAEKQEPAPKKQPTESKPKQPAQKDKPVAAKRAPRVSAGEAVSDEKAAAQKDLRLADGELEAWREYGLSEELLLGLKARGFTAPTPIQSRALAKYFGEGHRDLLGAAPTGSGKTLAFGLPILNAIAGEPAEEGVALQALIIVPTRELALQIQEHLQEVSGYLRTPLRQAVLIGGMSGVKQQRLLARNPHIIIGTPGRIASTLDDASNGAALLSWIARLPFLVIDEADRMVEAGHFKDLDAVLARVYADGTWKGRSTFLFSATLNAEEEEEGRGRVLDKRGHVVKTTMGELRAKVRFCTPPASVSISTAHRVAEGIAVSKLYCLPEEKDLYLVALLLGRRALGKVLVFVNAIDILKRVAPVVEQFGLRVATLHAHQQQRQRLAHLDRFKAASGMVLVTSDVAARGLDIERVDLVVHYHLPRQADTFVHRSGRTGRGRCGQGSAVALISPQEVELEARIVGHLRMAGRRELPDLEPPLDLARLDALRGLVDLARQVEGLQARLGREQKEASWAAKAAEDLGVDLDDGSFGPGRKQKKAKTVHDDGDGDNQASRKARQQLAALKANFNRLLQATPK